MEGSPLDTKPNHAAPVLLGQFKNITSQMANCNKIDVIIHESLSSDQEQNGDQIQQDIMQAFQDCQEPCMDNNNWKDG